MSEDDRRKLEMFLEDDDNNGYFGREEIFPDTREGAQELTN